MAKRKYEVAKIILKGVLISGGFVLACSNPAFAAKAPQLLLKELKYRHKLKKRRDEDEKYYNSFYYLRKKGLLKMEYRRKQLYISLTKEGEELATKYSIDDLKIDKPKKWDKKWRVLIFDIEEKHRMRRDALRGKLKELGLYQLQKSVWVCPYHFQKEVEVMKNFFALKPSELSTFVTSEIENEKELKNFFKII